MEQNLSLYYVFHTVAKNGQYFSRGQRTIYQPAAISKSIQKSWSRIWIPFFLNEVPGVLLLPQMGRSFSSIPEMLLRFLKKEKRFWHAIMLLE